MEHKVEEIRSFGRCARGTSDVYFPCDEDDIQKVFAIASQSPQRRVAIRGGGHSFDSQAVHDADLGANIILNTRHIEPDLIEFNFNGKPDLVRLGAGVTWRRFVDAAIERSVTQGKPIQLPGSLQTGRDATIAGTLAGNTLSRFSGTSGKENRWIESFRLVTPRGESLDVSRGSHGKLFQAVVGGHGYIGVVTEVVYRLVSIEPGSCAQTTISRHESFRSLIDEQLQLVRQHQTRRPSEPIAVSSAWFVEIPGDTKIKGAVFNSRYAQPSNPPLLGFPLYNDIEALGRYWIEVLARFPAVNLAIHEILYQIAGGNGGRFENDLRNFLFFMDGNTVAKRRFEERHPGQQFPIVQQTYVIPPDRTEKFAKRCEAEMAAIDIRPTECDMLFAQQDDCFLSANYKLDGFAVTLGFEPIAPKGCPPDAIPQLLHKLSELCLEAGGRIHLVKNVCAPKDVLREMFSQIDTFEAIKREHDPGLLLQNSFSDRLLSFSA